MSDALKDLNIKFGMQFSVNDSVLTDSNDPDHLLQRQKNEQLMRFGHLVDSSKKNMWTDRVDLTTNERIYSTTLYILTPDELKQYRESIIAKTRRGEFDEQA